MEWLKLKYNKRIQYLGIRSRDCNQNKFVARILCYGVSDEDLEKQQDKLIKNAQAFPNDFICKKLVKSHNGKKIFPKQIGYSINGLSAKNNKEFIALVEKYAQLYLQVLKDWE